MTTGVTSAAIRPAKPWPIGTRTPWRTSSSMPLAAVATRSPVASSSSSTAAVSTSRISRTRSSSSASRSDTSRWVRAECVTASRRRSLSVFFKISLCPLADTSVRVASEPFSNGLASTPPPATAASGPAWWRALHDGRVSAPTLARAVTAAAVHRFPARTEWHHGQRRRPPVGHALRPSLAGRRQTAFWQRALRCSSLPRVLVTRLKVPQPGPVGLDRRVTLHERPAWG